MKRMNRNFRLHDGTVCRNSHGRTGCCGCPISYKAVDDLEKIKPYEPNVVKAAWNIFGKSYEYRAKYNDYKEHRKEELKSKREKLEGQISFEEG